MDRSHYRTFPPGGIVLFPLSLSSNPIFEIAPFSWPQTHIRSDKLELETYELNSAERRGRKEAKLWVGSKISSLLPFPSSPNANRPSERRVLLRTHTCVCVRARELSTLYYIHLSCTQRASFCCWLRFPSLSLSPSSSSLPRGRSRPPAASAVVQTKNLLHTTTRT